jgi:hypothetical protein
VGRLTMLLGSVHIEFVLVSEVGGDVEHDLLHRAREREGLLSS